MSLLNIRYKELSEKYVDTDRAQQKRSKIKTLIRMKRRKQIQTLWKQWKEKIRKGFWKVFLTILTIGLLIWLSYIGVKWWREAPGFQAEENAAIITAIAAFITVFMTVYANYRSQKQNQRTFVHSRIYDKKMEAYVQMAELLHEMNMAYFSYDFSGEEKYRAKVRTLFTQIMSEIVPRYLLFISNDVLDYLNDMHQTMPRHQEETEQEIEEKYEQFLLYYYEPLMDEFRKELGTESITKELREMVDFQSSEEFRLF